jgi:hemerythrin
VAHFEWTPDLETGHAAIDDQHRTLFALANSLQDAIEAEVADAETVADAVWRLTDYVVQHFGDEQELMAEAGYPTLPVHISLHEQLTAETMRMTARLMNGEDVIPDELAPFVARWLRDHIGSADRAFVSWLADRR